MAVAKAIELEKYLRENLLDKQVSRLVDIDTAQAVLELAYLGGSAIEAAFLHAVGDKFRYEGYIKPTDIFTYDKGRIFDRAGKWHKAADSLAMLQALVGKAAPDFINKDVYVTRYGDWAKRIQDNNDAEGPAKGLFELVMREMIRILAGCRAFTAENMGPNMVNAILQAYVCGLGDTADVRPIEVAGAKKKYEKYFYDAGKVKITFIDSVESYLAAVTENKQGCNGRELFFRGHGSTNYTLVPSVYRSAGARTNEYSMCEDLQRLCPGSFEKAHSNLDKLVEMQHYELPTRLLDVSENCLVALYFACDGVGKGQDGEVLLLCQEKERVKYGGSDTVMLLTALSQLTKDVQDELYRNVWQYQQIFMLPRGYHHWLVDDILFSIDVTQTDPDFADIEEQIGDEQLIWSEDLAETLEELGAKYERKKLGKGAMWLRFLFEHWDSECFSNGTLNWEGFHRIREEFNKLRFVEQLIWRVQHDKSFFAPRVVPHDLTSVQFVRPQQLNPRIVKQSGAFMVCGLMPEGLGAIMERLNRYRYSVEEAGKAIRPVLIIPHEAKKGIREQLALCDLHQATIYPEIDKVAQFLKEKYADA